MGDAVRLEPAPEAAADQVVVEESAMID